MDIITTEIRNYMESGIFPAKSHATPEVMKVLTNITMSSPICIRFRLRMRSEIAHGSYESYAILELLFWIAVVRLEFPRSTPS